MKDKIKIGLLLDDYMQPHWIYKMLEEIKSQDIAEIKLIIKNKPGTAAPRSFFTKIKENYAHALYVLLRSLELKLSKPSPDAFALKDISALIDVTNTASIEVTPVAKIHSDYFTDADIEKVKEKNLDVLVRLGFRILRGKILKSSRYGIWSYHHGDNKVNRGGPAGVWESIEKWRSTGSILQIITEDLDGGEVLYRSWSCTEKLTISRNRNNFYWKSTAFLPRTLKRLYDLGPEKFFGEISEQNQHPDFYSNRLFKNPRNTELLNILFEEFFSAIKYIAWRSLNFNQWVLLYSFKKGNGISASMFKYKKMLPPKDAFWADPCVVFKDDSHFIFLEEFTNKTNRGHISVIEIAANGDYKKPEIVLQKEYHLSYPFVFENNGEWYMIPESAENKTIELYKCIDFPHKWEFVMNLMENVFAYDTTIQYHNEKYWLFAGIKQYEGASGSDELFLFHAEELLTTNWTAHTANPVVSDVRTARPAGRLFMHNNNLYRPSQDCSGQYGSAININHITVLDENKYEEVVVNRIEANWDKKINRTHTISFSNGLTVIDGLMSRSRYT